MKKVLYLLPALASAILITSMLSCEPEPTETCDQDEYCDAQMVTVCCDGGVCVYKYDGKDYPDSDAGLKQLAEDLGCGIALDYKSTDNSNTVQRLKALMQRVKSRSQR